MQQACWRSVHSPLQLALRGHGCSPTVMSMHGHDKRQSSMLFGKHTAHMCHAELGHALQDASRTIGR